MKDKNVFIDTNILAYAIMDDKSPKHSNARTFLENIDNRTFISSQVLNELYSVLLRHGFEDRDIQTQCRKIARSMNVTSIDFYIIEKAWTIKNKYGFSIWDSLIIAAALEASCLILYSEDMQHEQVIEEKISILNPFKI
ncbi:MAG: PIN domain-containing protein [Verrucomicrobiota bacterium]|nr:PIN domain-containing protein [Verrucomicrobiota bacterium]